MSQTTEFGILNINGREPSVADKLHIHRRVLEHHHFQTRHRIILGDARHMAAVKDESVHLVVTSPPYFDLIEYADGAGQLGHVHDYEHFLEELDKVWKECLRVLIPGGRLCVVVGDVCRARRRFGKHAARLPPTGRRTSIPTRRPARPKLALWPKPIRALMSPDPALSRHQCRASPLLVGGSQGHRARLRRDPHAHLSRVRSPLQRLTVPCSPFTEPPPTMGLPPLSAPPRRRTLPDRQITARPVRPSRLHCKPTLNLLSFFSDKRGTGGWSSVAFLRKALDLTFFPELFDVRIEIGA